MTLSSCVCVGGWGECLVHNLELILIDRLDYENSGWIMKTMSVSATIIILLSECLDK